MGTAETDSLGELRATGRSSKAIKLRSKWCGSGLAPLLRRLSMPFNWLASLSARFFFAPVNTRVAKCHGYDGYNRVKILTGWGKSLGEHANLAFWGENLYTIVRLMCID